MKRFVLGAILSGMSLVCFPSISYGNQPLSEKFTSSVAKKLNVSSKEARNLINIVFEQLSVQLLKENTTEIPGFGQFYLQHRRERKMKHYKTGRSYLIPARRYPRYRPSQIFKNRLNPK